MQDYSISDEQLSAYIDNQLATEERTDVLAAIKQDLQLSRQVTELQELKEWVRMAYQEPPQAPSESKPELFGSSRGWQAIAASVMLLLGGRSAG